MERPYAPACDRNRDPILEVLQICFAGCRTILEIGSGTGQHAVHFAKALPHLTWQTSDVADNLPGVKAWLEHEALPNTPPPLLFDVDTQWPVDRYDGIFTANTLHIMSWAQVQTLFERLPSLLADRSVVAIYGPFNYAGKFTSESNAAFNDWLLARGAHMAIRDIEAVQSLADAADLRLADDIAMPANNRMLIFRR